MAVSSLYRVAAASGTVLITTLDDCVWLVPLVRSNGNDDAIAFAHVAMFVTTLTSMAALVVLATVLASSQLKVSEATLSVVGAILCWILAAFLFIRKMLKNRRKQREQEQQSEAHPSEKNALLATPTNKMAEALHNDDAENQCVQPRIENLPFQPCMVVSLTLLGSLDEISYFPSLILGNIFSPTELILGTFLAAIIMAVVVTVALRQCKPCMECFDRIPLYAVVAAFASILTVECAL